MAAFKGALDSANGHLSYTASNAEEAKHAPLASQRDAALGAYQATLVKIDPTDPTSPPATSRPPWGRSTP